MTFGSRTALSAAVSWTAIMTGSAATGGGSGRGVGVGCGVAVGVGAALVAGAVGEGLGWAVNDAAGGPLVAVHAFSTNRQDIASTQALPHVAVLAAFTGGALWLAARRLRKVG